MTFILLGFLFIYLLDNKKLKTVLCCLLPVILIMPAVFKPDSAERAAFYAGMLLVCASPGLERAASYIKFPQQIRTSAVRQEIPEEDLLDNKKKWHMIIAGYVVFILFAVFACVSIFRLNAKINSMYEITQDLRQQVETMTEAGTSE